MVIYSVIVRLLVTLDEIKRVEFQVVTFFLCFLCVFLCTILA